MNSWHNYSAPGLENGLFSLSVATILLTDLAKTTRCDGHDNAWFTWYFTCLDMTLFKFRCFLATRPPTALCRLSPRARSNTAISTRGRARRHWDLALSLLNLPNCNLRRLVLQFESVSRKAGRRNPQRNGDRAVQVILILFINCPSSSRRIQSQDPVGKKCRFRQILVEVPEEFPIVFVQSEHSTNTTKVDTSPSRHWQTSRCLATQHHCWNPRARDGIVSTSLSLLLQRVEVEWGGYSANIVAF